MAKAFDVSEDLVRHVRAHVAHVRAAAARWVGPGGELDVSIHACMAEEAGATVAYRAELLLAAPGGGPSVRVWHLARDAHRAVDGAFSRLSQRIAMDSGDVGHVRLGLGRPPDWAPLGTHRRPQRGARGRRSGALHGV